MRSAGAAGSSPDRQVGQSPRNQNDSRRPEGPTRAAREFLDLQYTLGGGPSDLKTAMVTDVPRP